MPGWDAATTAAGLLLVVEAWHSDRALVDEDPDGIGDGVRERCELGGAFDEPRCRRRMEVQREWKAALERVFERVDFLVTPTLTIFPPRLEERRRPAGVAVHAPGEPGRRARAALPVPTAGPLPASLQLIGPAHSEERLLAAGVVLEQAVAGG